MTKYEALIKKLSDAADEHPDDYVVLTNGKMQFFPAGEDPSQTMAHIHEQIKEEKVSVIFKKPPKGTLVIL